MSYVAWLTVVRTARLKIFHEREEKGKTDKNHGGGEEKMCRLNRARWMDAR